MAEGAWSPIEGLPQQGLSEQSKSLLARLEAQRAYSSRGPNPVRRSEKHNMTSPRETPLHSVGHQKW